MPCVSIMIGEALDIALLVDGGPPPGWNGPSGGWTWVEIPSVVPLRTANEAREVIKRRFEAELVTSGSNFSGGIKHKLAVHPRFRAQLKAFIENHRPATFQRTFSRGYTPGAYADLPIEKPSQYVRPEIEALFKQMLEADDWAETVEPLEAPVSPEALAKVKPRTVDPRDANAPLTPYGEDEYRARAAAEKAYRELERERAQLERDKRIAAAEEKQRQEAVMAKEREAKAAAKRAAARQGMGVTVGAMAGGIQTRIKTKNIKQDE